jgi:hypothetical protein
MEMTKMLHVHKPTERKMEKQNIERRRQKQLASFEAQETEAVQLHYQQRQQKKSFYHVSRPSLNKL